MIQFKDDKPVFLQLADRLMDEIVGGTYLEEQRAPSVREYAAQFEVNPNTVVKAYEQLEMQEIIYQKRGLGFFVTSGARKRILQQRHDDFMNNQLPQLFRTMRELDITIDDLRRYYDEDSEKLS